VNKLIRCALLWFLALSISGCSGGKGDDSGSGTDTPSPDGYLVGAHYYLWFPQKFHEGFLRNKLSPAQEPELGIYDSTSTAVVQQHISWAAQYGISFFTLLWNPKSSAFNHVVADTFLQARNLGDIRFCIFYNTGELASSRGGITVIDQAAQERFFSDLDYFADNLFSHPQHLRIGARPVLILYVTRTLTGDYAAMIRAAREHMRTRGIEIFLLADEIFWDVTTHREGPDPAPYITQDPQAERVALFDAIFAYNMYEGNRASQGGYGADSSYIGDIEALYRRYQRTLPPSGALIPYVMPGYNDRGVRPAVDHFAIPREYSLGAGEGSFFDAFAQRLVFPFVNDSIPMVLITSWNEWSEDTAIEPAAEAPFTAEDQSSSGSFFTQGYRYSGHGLAYLEAVRRSFVAASGRVTDRAGRPQSGIKVQAWQAGHIAAAARSNSEGRYTLSSRFLKPGPADITVGHARQRAAVTIPRYDLDLQTP
jgi:glycoprotein endo-alpha-1,2-mannosidase